MISIGPFRCRRCCLQGFYPAAPDLSEAIPFVYLASVCSLFGCLISALRQAGGGDLLFSFASLVQSCCGEGGALQAEVAVRGEHSPCSGQAACSFGGLSPGTVRLFPPQRGVRAARGLVLSPRAHRTFSLRGPSTRRRSGLRESSDRNRGLFAGWEGVASLGLSLPLAPPPAS